MTVSTPFPGLSGTYACGLSDSIPQPDGTCVQAGSSKSPTVVASQVGQCFYNPSALGVGAPSICAIAWIAAAGILYLLLSGGK
jgi:hypothetical protein